MVRAINRGIQRIKNSLAKLLVLGSEDLGNQGYDSPPSYQINYFKEMEKNKGVSVVR
jgi:hypothetical protein